MRNARIALLVAMSLMTPALAQVSIHIDRPGVHIGINVSNYPTLQRVPGYPVYYAPAVRTNYFFYDGLYWVYEGGEWQASSWFNGPWHRVDRFEVPVSLLHVPVRYYRAPPAEFRAWRVDAPPHWHEQWGASWSERRAGWESWEQRSAPAPAPLPVYQRAYSGQRYPAPEQQAVIQVQSYRYQPREAVAQRVFEERKEVAEHAKVKAKKHDRDGDRTPPGLRRDERGMPEHAKGKAKGHDRDDDDRDRGPPEHAKGKGKGH